MLAGKPLGNRLIRPSLPWNADQSAAAAASAVAVAMTDGPEEGLALVDGLTRTGALDGYYLLPAARAALLRRLRRSCEAAAAYREALALVRTEPERRFLAARLAEVDPPAR